MVVRTYWPGATAQQVAEQVTDKIERTLQEVPYADKIRSYSKPGESQIIFQIKDSSRAARGAQRLVHGAQEGGRHALPPCQAGMQGPFFNDEFGDVYGVIYALEADGFQLCRGQDLCRRRAPAAAARADVAKVELFGVQDEKLYIEISQKRLAQLGWT
jgi:multidrug efflux pump